MDGRRKGRRGLKRAEMSTKAGRDVCTEADAEVAKQIAADTEQVVWGAQRVPCTGAGKGGVARAVLIPAGLLETA